MTLVTGAIKVLDIPDDVCISTARNLVLSLERLLGIEFDASMVTNVYVSTTEPEETDRTIWYKLDNSGNFVGVYVFVQGQWLVMFPVPGQLFRIVGSSDSIPPGYALADENIDYITDLMAAFIKTTWYEDPGDPGTYLVFDIVYVGL